MHRTTFALLVLAAAQAQAQDDEGPLSVFVVGDSHVFHLGREINDVLEKEGFEGAGYESRHGWSTDRYGRAGDLTQLLVESGSPEIVVVSLGGNDSVRSRAVYRAQIESVVEQVRAAGARQIVWIGPAESDAEIAAFTAERHERNAELQREILAELGVTWIDSRPHTHAHRVHDGVHFTRDGYEVWACGVCGQVLVAITRQGV